MELELVNALGWIRSRPERFFPGGIIDPVVLLTYLMSDVVRLGGGECTIRRSGDWWLIGSDVDWLVNASIPLVDLFARVVPAPKHGEHSMRGEVLVSAFATSTWIARSGSERVCIRGDEPSDSVWSRAIDMHRVILFRIQMPDQGL